MQVAGHERGKVTRKNPWPYPGFIFADRARPVSKMTVGQNYAPLTKQAEQHLAVVPITASSCFRKFISVILRHCAKRIKLFCENFLDTHLFDASSPWIIFKAIARTYENLIAIIRQSFYKCPRGLCTLQPIRKNSELTRKNSRYVNRWMLQKHE